MKDACMECKYFDFKDGHYGDCKMHNRLKRPSECCEFFTSNAKKVNTSFDDRRIDDLEDRIDKLEKIIFKLL